MTLQAQRPAGPGRSFGEAPDEAAEAAAVADWLCRAAAGVDYREMAVLFRINAQSPASSRLWPSAASRTWCAAASGSTSGPRCARRCHAPHPGAAAERYGDGAAGGRPGPGGARGARLDPEATRGCRGGPRALGVAGRAGAVAEDLAEDRPTPRRTCPKPRPARLTLRTCRPSSTAEPRRSTCRAAQGVTVSTLHSAKGLEWDAVALFGIQEGSLPFVLATRPEEVAEERRLLYVG